ncbi:MAG: preprotein translocase subunit SecE [SAR324 cluster bacterium]|uniref:Protein translocase subunit SecE n=1 Tax=SAR324 cluster bacterium TaxID=2024889 RepID=A0A2A4T805_9DELT|nr:MAG: preprotein translocase subunit SecE [SAR324 cluster bacterium]
MFGKIKNFLSDVRNEFKKVTWPTREQTIKQTGAVLVITGIISVFLGIIDVGLSELVKQIIG